MNKEWQQKKIHLKNMCQKNMHLKTESEEDASEED